MFEKIRVAQSNLMNAAAELASDPANDELWRELCRARATLRAYVKCAA